MTSIFYSPIEAIAVLTGGGQAAVMVMLLVLVAVLSLVALLAQTLAALREIRTATSIVEAAQSKADFARLLNSISAQVETLPMLSASWRRFKATLLQPGTADGARGALLRTASASPSFSAHDIGQRWPVFRAMPGLLFVLTLLLTVAGLALSMQDAHVWLGETAPNTGSKVPQLQPERFQRVADQLLAAGGAALGIAIVGLILSLVLSAALATCSAAVASRLSRLTSALDQRVATISFETIVLEQLTGQGQNFGPALDDAAARLESKLRKPLNDLQSSLTGVSDRLSRMQAAIMSGRTGGPDATAVLLEVRQEFAALRTSLEAKASDAASQQQAMLSRAVDGFAAKADQDRASQSLREIASDISEIRNRMALQSPTNVAPVVVPEVFLASQADLERTQSNVAALHTNLDIAVARLSADSRAAMAELATLLGGKIDHLSVPQQRVLDDVAVIKGKVSAPAAPQLNFAEVFAEFRHASTDLKTSVARLAQQASEDRETVRRDSASNVEQATMTLSKASRDLERQIGVLTTRSQQMVTAMPSDAWRHAETAARTLAETSAAIEQRMDQRAVQSEVRDGAAREAIEAFTKDAIKQLTAAAADFRNASQARSLAAADIEHLRAQLLLQAEEVSAETAARLRDTAAEVAEMMSGYRSDLTVSAGTLVLALQALSQDMRRLDQKPAPARPAALSSFTGYRPASSAAAPAQTESVEAMLGQLLANMRTR